MRARRLIRRAFAAGLSGLGVGLLTTCFLPDEPDLTQPRIEFEVPSDTRVVIGEVTYPQITVRAGGVVLTDPEIQLESEDIAIASIDSDSGVRGVWRGVVEITAVFMSSAVGDSAPETSFPVKVVIDTVLVGNPVGMFTALGETALFDKEARDPDGGIVRDTITYRWVSSDTTVVEVDSITGLVKAIRNGGAKITAMAVQDGVSGADSVWVSQVVTSVNVTPDSASNSTDTLRAIGETTLYRAEARDANGSTVDSASFAWASSDTTVATTIPIDSQTAQVTAEGNGEAVVTATTRSDGSAPTSTSDVSDQAPVDGGGGKPRSLRRVVSSRPQRSPARPLVRSAGAGSLVGPAAADTTGTHAVTVRQAAARLSFTSHPGNTIAGDSLSSVVVSILDPNDEPVTADPDPATTESVVISLNVADNEEGAVLSGAAPDSVDWSTGTVTFDSLWMDKVGSYTLDATPAGTGFALDIVTSNGFMIYPDSATRLVFTPQPTDTIAGDLFTVIISAWDEFGNVDTSFTDSVTVAITPSTGKPGATLSDTLTRPAQGGVATFADLSIDSAGIEYTLTASANAVEADTSVAFTINPGSGVLLSFTVQPRDAVAGDTFAPSIEVTAYDLLGNVATGFSQLVAITITAGTGTTGANLLGPDTVSASAGVSTFLDLSIDSAGTGYTLDATATGLQGAMSDSFNITAGAATKLTFTVEPSSTVAGDTISPAVVVTSYDGFGNVDTSFTDNVTVAITGGTGKPGATLSGTTTRFAVAGVATFTDLSIDSAGTGYTLTATSGTLTPDTSTTFDINPVVVVITPAADTLTALGDVVTLSPLAQDASGDTVSGITFTWSSDNESIATVDGNGLVTAVANGTATITATAPGGASDNASITVRPFTAVTVGRNHSCGLTTDGAAYCWGRNTDGQLGVGDSTNSAFPVAVAINGVTFQSIAAGGNHTCALSTGGTVYCWGRNSNGQLGNASDISSPIPVAVTGSYKSIAAGTKHTCGITTTDAAYCWGDNGSGQLGNNDNSPSNVPVPVASSENFRLISAGKRHTCAVTTSDVGYCWGEDLSGQLGNGSAGTNDVLVPGTVQTSLTFQSISAGDEHTCAIATTSGDAYCWGGDFSGQLGNGPSVTQENAPVAVQTSLMFQSISAGDEHTCGLTTTDAPQCWGENNSGQLGDGSFSTGENAPVAVQTSLTFQSISTGSFHTCGLTTTGAVYCWGGNFNGQLGNRDTMDSNVPTRVSDP